MTRTDPEFQMANLNPEVSEALQVFWFSAQLVRQNMEPQAAQAMLNYLWETTPDNPTSGDMAVTPRVFARAIQVLSAGAGTTAFAIRYSNGDPDPAGDPRLRARFDLGVTTMTPEFTEVDVSTLPRMQQQLHAERLLAYSLVTAYMNHDEEGIVKHVASHLITWGPASVVDAIPDMVVAFLGADGDRVLAGEVTPQDNFRDGVVHWTEESVSTLCDNDDCDRCRHRDADES